MTAPVEPSITTIAGLESEGFFINSSKTGGIDSGASAALAAGMESISARQTLKTLFL